ncbi:carbonyl reductase 1 [Echinococcus multilocularis]|uniref:Carbonyl reductase 1 n=1 Tax=Echinococcus multilocularis TaxID=6211 RepID=A0A087VYI4_ECHMU|nr:carbonyl reductase 1 [Echinococcus multilocularis]
MAMMSLRAMSKEMAAKFKGHLSLHELDELMVPFNKHIWLLCIAIITLRHAEVGNHEKASFSNSAYGMSKVGLWKGTAILAEKFKSHPRHVLINLVSFFRVMGYAKLCHKDYKTALEGADTPVYLATLPKGATEPFGQFVDERQVANVDKECPL